MHSMIQTGPYSAFSAYFVPTFIQLMTFIMECQMPEPDSEKSRANRREKKRPMKLRGSESPSFKVSCFIIEQFTFFRFAARLAFVVDQNINTSLK